MLLGYSVKLLLLLFLYVSYLLTPVIPIASSSIANALKSEGKILKLAIPTNELKFLIGARTGSLAVMVYNGKEWIHGEIMVKPHNVTFYNSYAGKLSWYLIEPDTISDNDLVYITIPYIPVSGETNNWSVDMAINRIHSRGLIEITPAGLKNLGVLSDKPFKFYIYYDKNSIFNGRHIYFDKNDRQLLALSSYHKLSPDSILILKTTTHRSFAVSRDFTRVLGFDKTPDEFKAELREQWYYFDGGGGGDTEPPPTVYWFDIPLYSFYGNEKHVILNNTDTGSITATDNAHVGIKSSLIELRVCARASMIEGGSAQSVKLVMNIHVHGVSTVTGNEYDDSVSKIVYVPTDEAIHCYAYSLPEPGPTWNLNVTIQYTMLPLDYGEYRLEITNRRLIISKTDLSGVNENISPLEKIYYYGLMGNSSNNIWVKGYNAALNTEEALLFGGTPMTAAKLENLPDNIGLYIRYLVDYATENDYLDIYVNGYLIHHIDGETLVSNNGIQQELLIPLSLFKNYILSDNIKSANPLTITIKSSLLTRYNTVVQIISAYLDYITVPGMDPADSKYYAPSIYCSNQGTISPHVMGGVSIPVYAHSATTELAGYYYSVTTGYEYYTIDDFKSIDTASLNLISARSDNYSKIYYVEIELYVPNNMPESSLYDSYTYSISLTSLTGGVPDQYAPIIKIILVGASFITTILDAPLAITLAVNAAKMYVNMNVTVSISLHQNGNYYVYDIIWDGGTKSVSAIKIDIRYHPQSVYSTSVSDETVYIKVDAMFEQALSQVSELKLTYPVKVRIGSISSSNSIYYTCTDPFSYYPQPLETQ